MEQILDKDRYISWGLGKKDAHYFKGMIADKVLNQFEGLGKNDWGRSRTYGKISNLKKITVNNDLVSRLKEKMVPKIKEQNKESTARAVGRLGKR